MQKKGYQTRIITLELNILHLIYTIQCINYLILSYFTNLYIFLLKHGSTMANLVLEMSRCYQSGNNVFFVQAKGQRQYEIMSL